MLKIQQHNKGMMWIARVAINDRQYHARSTMGASNQLAKMLRRMGIEDQPVRIYNPSGTDYIERMLYAWADVDYQTELRTWGHDIIGAHLISQRTVDLFNSQISISLDS